MDDVTFTDGLCHDENDAGRIPPGVCFTSNKGIRISRLIA